MPDGSEEVPGNIVFTKSTPPEGEARILETMKKGRDTLQKAFDLNYSEVPGLSQEINRAIEVVKDKLDTIGIKDYSILPCLDEMGFIENFNNSWHSSMPGSISGACDPDGLIMIHLDKDMKLPNLILDRVIYHEIAHFIAKRVFRKST